MCAMLNVAVSPSAKVDGFVINGPATEYTLEIGAGCVIRGKAFMTNGASLRIGAGTSVGHAAFYCHEGGQIVIGEKCLLSHGLSFRPSDAHKIFDIDSNERINPPAPIVIGNHVWIGENVLLMKGTVIPDGCVIASGSRVSGKFLEPNCVIGGNPARVLRTGIRWAP